MRSMRIPVRRLMVLPLLAALAFSTHAFAASSTTRTNSLGAGSTSVTACDTTFGFVPTRTGTGPSTVVTAVTVNGIAAACQGSRLQLTLADAADASLASGTVNPIPNGVSEVTVTLSSSVTATQVATVSVVVTGA